MKWSFDPLGENTIYRVYGLFSLLPAFSSNQRVTRENPTDLSGHLFGGGRRGDEQRVAVQRPAGPPRPGDGVQDRVRVHVRGPADAQHLTARVDDHDRLRLDGLRSTPNEESGPFKSVLSWLHSDRSDEKNSFTLLDLIRDLGLL